MLERPVRTRYLVTMLIVGLIASGATWIEGGVAAEARPPGTTVRMSVRSNEVQAKFGANTESQYGPVISADGRYVAFESNSPDLVPGDTNGVHDVFVRDRQAGTTRRVSVSSFEEQADGESVGPSISADGRYVAFQSASRLAPLDDPNNTGDVYIRDRQTGTTALVSVRSGGTPVSGGSDPRISADGRYVTFAAVTGIELLNAGLFMRDTVGGITTVVAPNRPSGAGRIRNGGISADGRYATFGSSNPRLVPGDTNGSADVFVRDLVEGITSRVSVRRSGAQSPRGGSRPAISADGRYVSFSSISRLVPGDRNGVFDVYVRDREEGTTKRVSLSNRDFGGNRNSTDSAISAHGGWVAFASRASNLVRGDTNGVYDVFLRRRATGTTRRISINSNGRQGIDHGTDASRPGWSGSRGPAMSLYARHVTFASYASNLVPRDTNRRRDAFLRVTRK